MTVCCHKKYADLVVLCCVSSRLYEMVRFVEMKPLHIFIETIRLHRNPKRYDMSSLYATVYIRHMYRLNYCMVYWYII
jgi:hypothetical protein